MNGQWVDFFAWKKFRAAFCQKDHTVPNDVKVRARLPVRVGVGNGRQAVFCCGAQPQKLNEETAGLLVQEIPEKQPTLPIFPRTTRESVMRTAIVAAAVGVVLLGSIASPLHGQDQAKKKPSSLPAPASAPRPVPSRASVPNASAGQKVGPAANRGAGQVNAAVAKTPTRSTPAPTQPSRSNNNANRGGGANSVPRFAVNSSTSTIPRSSVTISSDSARGGLPNSADGPPPGGLAAPPRQLIRMIPPRTIPR